MRAFHSLPAAVVCFLALLCVPATANGSDIVVPALSASALNAPSGADWIKAAHVNLATDFAYRRPADEATTISVASDARSLFVLAHVDQREAITDHTLTNGSGVLADDYVGVLLAPEGTKGFSYAFYANRRGAAYQTSSENNAFAPKWTAIARSRDGGYDVLLQIPYDIMKTNRSAHWSAQFVRYVAATGSTSVWTYDTRQIGVFDTAYAGTISFPQQAASVRSRPGARVQLYGLAEAAPPAYGGDTSRVGADFSLPVTPTSSFVATAHPDYSNVEIDQQSITPTAFPRRFTEVRPFLTQGANFFNQSVGCIGNCPTMLYTPAIPAFRDGYAYEGTAGHFTFGAFDAIGYSRADDAEAVNYNVSGPKGSAGIDVQRVSVKLPDDSRDTVLSVATGAYDSRSHLLAYVNAASEYGSFIQDRHAASSMQAGAGYTDQTTTAVIALDAVGAQFSPVDGFVPLPDSLGIEGLFNKSWSFSPKSTLRSLAVNYDYAHSRNSAGQVNEHSNLVQLSADTKSRFTLSVGGNFTSLRTVQGELLPFNDLSVHVGFRENTSAPTFVEYGGGRYYHGTIGLPSFGTTVRLGRRLHLTGFATATDYRPATSAEPRATQWLQRLSLDAQLSHALSVDAGVRRIVGRDAPASFFVPSFQYRNAMNLSGALHYLSGKNELFVVYGDPNALATQPTLVLKFVRYIGAQKGT